MLFISIELPVEIINTSLLRTNSLIYGDKIENGINEKAKKEVNHKILAVLFG